MRISDWSSDVCSSDLAPDAEASPPAHRGHWHERLFHVRGFEGVDPMTDRLPADQCERLFEGETPLKVWRSEERRVGKEVSVRVDLGGRRIIKKKKNKEH